eukprot:3905798-Amphidinium_carterae.1
MLIVHTPAGWVFARSKSHFARVVTRWAVRCWLSVLQACRTKGLHTRSTMQDKCIQQPAAASS